MLTSCFGVISMLQQSEFELGMLSGAQVDRYGNLNPTVLGSYAKLWEFSSMALGR